MIAFPNGKCVECGRLSTVSMREPGGNEAFEICELHLGGFLATPGDELMEYKFRLHSSDIYDMLPDKHKRPKEQ